MRRHCKDQLSTGGLGRLNSLRSRPIIEEGIEEGLRDLARKAAAQVSRLCRDCAEIAGPMSAVQSLRGGSKGVEAEIC